MSSPKGKAANSQPIGQAALIASVGGERGFADWTNPDHRLRRLLAEFLGMAGLTFILSGGAAILARYGGHGLQPWQTVLVLSAVSALWLVVAAYFLGDISAHFNPATTLAFALRRDMGWVMAGAYWVVQLVAGVCGSLLARAFFGVAGNLIGARRRVYEKEKKQSERPRANGAFSSSAARSWRMKARTRRKKGERMEKT
jgi:glycerol uptake facilitator-like aquaporin